MKNLIVLGSASSALESAKTTLVAQIKPIINEVVVPLAVLALVILLIIGIVKSVSAYREGEGVKFAWPLLVVCGIVLISTFPMWGWQIVS